MSALSCSRAMHWLRSASRLLILPCCATLCCPQSLQAMDTRTGLKLVVEVRNHIHRHYVEPVDSIMVIDAALDGMMSALPRGENLYISPREMAEVDSIAPPRQPSLTDRQQLGLLTEAFRVVSRGYVERISVDTLSRGLVRGMLSALDPHSSYLDPAQYDEMVERFRGDFEGIGIYFEVRGGKLMVIAPIVGSPSYGKLRAGDHISEIEGISTLDITNEQVMKKLRGPKGSTVQVTIIRQGRSAPFTVDIRRDRIEVHSVPYVFMIRPGTGYVRIARFAETTGQELESALTGLRKQGMTRLLLDLRGNGGGLLGQAVEVADCFLDRGQLAVYTEGRTAASRHEYHAQRPALMHGVPTVVLIDHGSASAAEIVAGALQDLDIALIVGQTSFGKGLVQEQFPLRSNGGLLLLTVARYYTPLGRLIQRPYSQDLQAYYQQGVDDFDPNAVDSLRANKEVFRTASGRKVYGGGGITPDVVLANESSAEFMYELYASNTVTEFSTRWVAEHPDPPRQFSTYLREFAVGDEDVRRFQALLDSAAVPVDAETLATYDEDIRRELKAGIAQVLWGDEQRYQVHIQGSSTIRAALESMDAAGELIGSSPPPAGRSY